MCDYPIRLEQIVSWFRSKEQGLRELGITLAEVRESHTNKPAATANFDTALAVGQIIVWVSGEIDFEVLRASDGKVVFICHEKVSNLGAPLLKGVFDDFLRSMMHPDKAV